MKKTRLGAASFYVVIFTTLLLSVITMSFIRIMISEANKSTNDDLSKSAYDSALAGIEDAKIALMKYHKCLDQGKTAGTASSPAGSCEAIIYAMEQGTKNSDCDVVSKVLGRNSGGEVVVQENPSSSDSESSSMLQAYTCVKISEELADYRSQVNTTHHVRLVPLRTADASSVKAIRFRWFANDATHASKTNVFSYLPNLTEYLSGDGGIPFMNIDIIQTDADYYTLGELSLNSNTGTDHASLFFRPTSDTGETILSAADVLDLSDKANNTAYGVACGNNTEFKCQSIINLPPTFRGNASRSQYTFLLRVELPYGVDDTDFSVSLCTGQDANPCDDERTEIEKFVGVQAEIDSTGRANDVFRRVDARVELIDTNYPYPDFTVQLSGTGNSTLKKQFWVTNNCWASNKDEGVVDCDDSGNANVTYP